MMSHEHQVSGKISTNGTYTVPDHDVFADSRGGKLDLSNAGTADVTSPVSLNHGGGGSGTGIVRSHSLPPGSRTYGTSGPISLATQPCGQPGDLGARLESFKVWGVNTYKCTRQIIQEKLGKTVRTHDAELEAKIEQLRDGQARYRCLLDTARRLTEQLRTSLQTQRSLGDLLAELGQRQPELGDEFGYNAETQRLVCRNGDQLLAALDFFTKSVDTLCNKTMEDTVVTIRQFEQARIEYDAYRADAAATVLVSGGSSNSTSAGSTVRPHTDPMAATRAQETRQKCERHQAKYEKLKNDVEVKMRFLDENRVRVMQKQLVLFHNAISAYFSGNQAALDATMKQFSIKVKTPNSDPPSWLEHPQQH